MTNKEFIEKMYRIFKKVDDALNSCEFETYVVSDDPDCDSDIGISENGFLVLKGEETNLSVSDVKNIKYKARYVESEDYIKGYIKLICEDNIDFFLYLDPFMLNMSIEINGRCFSYRDRVFDIITSPDFKKEKDFWLNKKGDTLLAYFGDSIKAVIPDGVTIIGQHAFAGTLVEEVVASSTLKRILEYAFLNCSSLKKIDLGNVEEIGHFAFRECSSLCGIIEIPSCLKKIGWSSFPSSLKEKDFNNHSSINVVTGKPKEKSE